MQTEYVIRLFREIEGSKLLSILCQINLKASKVYSYLFYILVSMDMYSFCEYFTKVYFIGQKFVYEKW